MKMVCRMTALLLMAMVASQVHADTTTLKMEENTSADNPVLSSKPTGSKYDATVLVLGAGFSGITAAKTLSENNIDFLMLEGSNRIGGRMKSVTIGENKVNEGAMWISGTEGNFLTEHARKHNITHRLTDWDNYAVIGKGGEDLTEKADELYEPLEIALEFKDKLADEYLLKDNPDTSVHVGLRLGGWVATTPVMHAIEWYDIDFEAAQQSEMTSLKYDPLYTYTDFSEDDSAIIDQRGYEYMAETLYLEFMQMNDSRLHLNTIVQEIAKAGDKVIVTTTGNITYKADYVLVTFSLGVLQHNEVKFSPALPEWKKESIDLFQMNIYTTIYMKFPANQPAFWSDTEIILYAGERRGYFPCWFNIDYIVPGSRILQVTVNGDEANRLNNLTDAEVQAEAMDVLKDMYGANISHPEEIHVPRWLDDPLVRGSYSNWPVGYPGWLHDGLKAPVHDARIHFAGEHCSERYFGYVHGAYASGLEQANKLINCMKDKKTCEDYQPKGCKYKGAANYNPSAKLDDGSCIFPTAPSGFDLINGSIFIISVCLVVPILKWY